MEVARGVYRITVTGNRYADPDRMAEYFHGHARNMCSAHGFASYDWSISSTGALKGTGPLVATPEFGGHLVVVEHAGRGRVLEGDVTCAKKRPPTWRAPSTNATEPVRQVLDTSTGRVLEVAPSAATGLLSASRRYTPIHGGRVAVVDDTGAKGYILATDWAQAKDAGYQFEGKSPTAPTTAAEQPAP
ncbi:hypothetical protein LZ198_22905 [Myxococcus sp. K15C18031901]|uniref:hypothetical protein n=1 Tax=Myxococcus dinghuensis TaxID=2906761 RepID=UPI0020A70695|nr:hypothetical protein [Myxococcus dinghuensis]MCP3101731.1 hypothetical protein [Myxococcus dinghuensis]